ncbi:MAG: hypothetical protein KAR12_12525 [Methylococcales bacterium]|nr:hypothetical protein [Methylococcales bacterium]
MEAATQEALEALGWTVEYAWNKENFSAQDDRSDGLLGRSNKSEIILVRYLFKALQKLNPDLPMTAY